VHGMAQVNAQVRSVFDERGVDVNVYDLSGGTLQRGIGVRLARVGRVARNILRFAGVASRAHGSVLYLGLSGSWGQAYEIVFVALARVFGFTLYLHHHSFAYLNRSKKLTRVLIWIAGKGAHHVTLCDSMATALRRHYGRDLLVRVVSNAALIEPWHHESASRRTALRSLGYLGNISREKGVLLFIEILEELNKRGAKLVGRIAGPFQDDEIKAIVLDRITGSGYLHYLGPQYEGEKIRFLDSIDVLVFPSRYENEAEPLTVHEAMSRGAPVLSLDRGCIREIVPCEAGAVLKDNETIVSRAADVLMEWWRNPEMVAVKSEGAIEAYLKLRQLHLSNLTALCSEMASGL